MLGVVTEKDHIYMLRHMVFIKNVGLEYLNSGGQAWQLHLSHPSQPSSLTSYPGKMLSDLGKGIHTN